MRISVRCAWLPASAFLVFFSLALPLAASTRTWSGAVSGLWSEPGNWGGAAPVAGDALVFPAGASHQTCTNDLPAGTAFLSLAFTGGTYTVGGSSLTPGAGGISTPGAHVTFTGPIVFSGSVVIDGGGPGGSITFAGPVTGTPTQVSLVGSGPFTFSNGANGWSGPLVLDGSGLPGVLNLGASGAIPSGVTVEVQASETLALQGFSNTIANLQGAGTVALGGGTLTVARDSMTSGLFTGAVLGSGSLLVASGNTLRLTGPSTASGALRCIGQSTLFLLGTTWPGPVALEDEGAAAFSDDASVGPLTLSGISSLTPGGGGTTGTGSTGDLGFAAGTTFRVLVNGTATGAFSQVHVTGSVTLGGATLEVVRTVPVPLGWQFLVIDNDGTDPVSGTFSGLPEGGSTPDGWWSISYVGGTGNDVVLTLLTMPVNLQSFTVE